MGCYPPLVKFVSRALRKCNGGRDNRWREERLDYAMAYPPGPPMETHYMRPVARTVTFSRNNNVYVIPRERSPPPSPPPPQQEQEQSTPQEPPQQQQPEAPPPRQDAPPPQPQQEEPPAPPEQEKARDAPPPPAEPPKPPRGPKRGTNKKTGGRSVRFGSEPPPQEQQEQHEPPEDPGNGGGDAPSQQRGHGPQRPGPAYLFRYTPSPLPRWEATPRRHEYFSGEYRSYYPTPVREGIYRIATDANRLTTIFSEENPNACAIV